MVNTSSAQTAPGQLEAVRTLLNSWSIPNDTRQPADRFDAYADEHRCTVEQRSMLRRLRDELRPAVERSIDIGAVLDGWIERLDVRPRVIDGAVAYRHRGGPTGDIVAAVLAAVATGRWSRLKACPDCRWVFYDHTRNGAKRWCLMTAGGPDGRSCGSIAKVRAFRARRTSR